MKLSKTGLILSAVYISVFTMLFLLGFTFTDVKSRYVLQQLAVFPAIGVLLGLWGSKIFHIEWLNSFPLLLILNTALAYGSGWAFDTVRAFLKHRRVRAEPHEGDVD